MRAGCCDNAGVTYAPPPYTPPAAALADPTAVMGRRVVAHLIDLILISALGAVLFFATADKITGVPEGYCTESQYSPQRTRSCVQIGDTAYQLGGGRNASNLLYIGGAWTLVGLIEGATGAFIGKRLLGLRVVGADGNLAGAGRGAVRGVMMLVDLTCFAIGLFIAAFTKPHRRLGDMVGGTYVVGKDSVGRPIPGSPASGSYVPYAPPMQSPGAGAGTGGGFTPGTYGTSLPPSAPAPTPQSQEPAQSEPQHPTAWGTPPEPAPQAQPAQPAQPAQQPQPQWDQARNAWIVWEPTRGQWLQWDATTSQWGPIS